MKPWTLSKTMDYEVLRYQVNVKRLTDQQLADIYETTAPTIRYHRLRANPPIKRKSVERIDHRAEGAIPWVLDVGQGHHMDPTARLLRNRNRLKHGQSVPADAADRVRRFEEHLAARGWVVNYTRERGFFTIDRDPKMDAPDSLVRMPRQKKK